MGAVLCNAVWYGGMKNKMRHIISHMSIVTLRMYKLPLPLMLLRAVCPTQDEGRERACATLLRWSGFGASGVVPASVRCRPLHPRTPHSSDNLLAATTAYRTSKCDGKLLHMAGHRHPSVCFSIFRQDLEISQF